MPDRCGRDDRSKRTEQDGWHGNGCGTLAESDCVVARGTTDAFAVVAMCAALGVNRVIVLGSVPTDDERLAGQLDFALGSLRMA